MQWQEKELLQYKLIEILLEIQVKVVNNMMKDK